MTTIIKSKLGGITKIKRIRWKGTKQYSNGRDTPRFSESYTQMWISEGPLKSHITRVAKHYPDIYSNSEIVEFDLIETNKTDLAPIMLGRQL